MSAVRVLDPGNEVRSGTPLLGLAKYIYCNVSNLMCFFLSYGRRTLAFRAQKLSGFSRKEAPDHYDWICNAAIPSFNSCTAIVNSHLVSSLHQLGFSTSLCLICKTCFYPISSAKYIGTYMRLLLRCSNNKVDIIYLDWVMTSTPEVGSSK